MGRVKEGMAVSGRDKRVKNTSGLAPLVLHVFPTFAPGGVQLRIAKIMEQLGGAYRHQILALDGNQSASLHLSDMVEAGFVDPEFAQSGLGSVLALRRFLRRLAPDLLCTYNWGAMDWALAGRFTALPHLHFESGFGPEEAEKPLRRRSLMRRLALSKVHKLVVPSHSLYRLALFEKWVLPKRLMLIPNGVDTAWFRRPGKQADHINRFNVVSVAPLRPEKRLDRLLTAFAQFLPTNPEAQLILLGEGQCRPALEDQAKALGIAGHVQFKGHVADIRPMLFEADLFAMTSQTEQMPNALLQAMAAGLPVLAYDAGDIARIVPIKARSFVYPQEDASGFRQGLMHLARDWPLRQKLGELCRQQAVTHYDLPQMVAAYGALYQDALDR
ncbi:glycosyltransferase family 4 protein [Iodidimonas muriae]|nr:glycosyltransferase family 4 protein [Iodidimonas muriae]